MAITVKTLKQPAREVSYLRATLQGMAITFRHVLRKKVTMEYPEQKSTAQWSLSQRWRGTQELILEGTDFAALGGLIGRLQERLQVASIDFSVSPARRAAAATTSPAETAAMAGR